MSTCNRPPVPAPGEGGVVLEEGHRGTDGGLVCVEHGGRGLLVAERPEHRDGLQRGEREGEARHGTLVHGGDGATKGASVARVAPLAEQALEALGADLLAGDPEGPGAVSGEAPGALGSGRVVVLPADGDLLGVVGPRQRRHLRQAHHRRDAPGEGRTSGAALSRTSVSVEEREGAGTKARY